LYWENGYIKAPEILLEPIEKEKRLVKKVYYYGNGHCVPYARARTGIQITGIAGRALEIARFRGYKTGIIPREGSIVVLNEGPVGHVAVVEKIYGDMLYISEQNYRGLYIVSERIISVSYDSILGYIY
jgi:surface antigen|tara:strand:- start:1636 stop:2019 length:384 start_codon:yes stop_codon:yes gene_type:complete